MPSEDQNRFVVNVVCPVGSSIDYVDEMLIVVRPGNSDRVGLSTTADLLARTRTEPAGFLVVGGTPGPTSSYYAYGRRRELFVEDEPMPRRTSQPTN